MKGEAKRKAAPTAIVVRTDADRAVVVIQQRFQVVAPLFGGGVHIEGDRPHRKNPDAVTPVRTASIRGQLRFWWRAAWGCQYPLATMREREALLFGRAGDEKGGRGRVAMRLEGRATTSSVDGVGNAIPSRAYGAFPLQPAREARDKTPGTLTAVSGRFELVLTIDRRELTDDDVEGVRRAVDAWLAFGGVGGRTRRGFGAVAADTVRDPAQELARLSAGLQNHAGVTSLAGARLVTHPKSDATALSALDRGLGRLKAFRQGPGIGRNPGTDDPRRPGRSRWPEADEIRRITGQADRKHRTPLTTTRAFPRAAFGLPIIFHFKDFGDPSDTTLKPRGTERMASPLIIRPYARDEGFGSFALRLSAPMPTPIELGNSAADNVPTAITDAEARSDLMRTALDGNSDVLGAFLKFFAGD